VFNDAVSKNLALHYYGISNASHKPHVLLTFFWRSKCNYSCKQHNV